MFTCILYIYFKSDYILRLIFADDGNGEDKDGDKNCRDYSDKCSEWFTEEFCKKTKLPIHDLCPKTCKMC